MVVALVMFLCLFSVLACSFKTTTMLMGRERKGVGGGGEVVPRYTKQNRRKPTNQQTRKQTKKTHKHTKTNKQTNKYRKNKESVKGMTSGEYIAEHCFETACWGHWRTVFTGLG